MLRFVPSCLSSLIGSFSFGEEIEICPSELSEVSMFVDILKKRVLVCEPLTSNHRLVSSASLPVREVEGSSPRPDQHSGS